ncbi:hypothetical protein [Capnocytophaga genosp. AHN8471]|uniref:hypothetical protein n=1 Tax=Capnocytophaga genosp. AHN8471 TaxID=327574 RepID=UPI00193408BF|nr:hypothetical protein [Capnocytophaga genosp. AHN8471]MBM0659915.1 hypothetical protein [Capnocytophaga genosp. AHN8471]
MKNFLLFLIFGMGLMSCSDNLTTSKTDKLIKEALAETTPFYGAARISESKGEFISKDDLPIYEKLVQEGYITMKNTELPYGTISKSSYDIAFTDKAKPYMIGNRVRAYTLVFDKTDEIQIVMQNKARVKAIFKKEDRTPFYDLSFLGKDETYMRTFTFDKTENKGWVTHSVLPMLRLSMGIFQKEQ